MRRFASGGLGFRPGSIQREQVRCRSSGVEHSLGKGEAESSNLSGSTITFNDLPDISPGLGSDASVRKNSARPDKPHVVNVAPYPQSLGKPRFLTAPCGRSQPEYGVNSPALLANRSTGGGAT